MMLATISPAGSVAGPVALVVQMNSVRDKARLLPGAKWPKQWLVYPDDCVYLSEEGTLATHTADCDYSLVHTGEELTDGRHFWEVEVLEGTPLIGVCRTNADLRTKHCSAENTTGWFMLYFMGTLCGNGKWIDDKAGNFEEGDRMGVLLDLDEGSILFFKNGVQHGPGYPSGSVTGPVALAVQRPGAGNREVVVRLLPGEKWPTGHTP